MDDVSDEQHDRKAEKLSHLEWSVKSRSRTQLASLRLYKLLEDDENRDTISVKNVRLLTGVSFSLWRAAFLTYRLGTKAERRSHAAAFLHKMLDDNTISFATDKITNGWSFNYYIEDAQYRLNELSEDYPSIVGAGLTPQRNNPRDRWDRLQEAFERMVTILTDSV